MNRRWLALICTCWLAIQLPAAVSDQFIQSNMERLESLVSRLDGHHPGLEDPVLLWKQGQQAAALKGISDYFKDRSFDLTLVESAYIPVDVLQRSQRALENVFYIHSEWIKVPETETGGIDWEYRGIGGDKENAWMLNRHVVLPILAEAHALSGSPLYRDRLNHLLTDWIITSPYPDRISFSARWRPLEAARRVLNSWIHVFFNDSTLLEDETRLLMLSSLPDHADALFLHASFWGGNHLLTEKIALLALATAWPEFTDSGRWKDNAIDIVSQQLMKQSYPDGSYMELSNHYQRVVITNTLPFLRLIKSSLADRGDSAVYRRIEAMWDYFAHSLKPDGWGPLNNASDREHNAGFLLTAWDQFNREDWLGIATNGREGTLPAGNPSRLFPWAGQVFMRSDWGRAADWVYFDAGPYGTAHQHVDRLHLSVSLEGEEILVDSGRYTYQPGIWKDYFQGARSHSVILLNGKASRQGPRKGTQPAAVNHRQLEGAVYASATAYFDGIGGHLRGAIPWTRHVLLDKRGFVLVLDQLLSFKDSEAEVLWQFAPGIDAQTAGRVITTGGPLPARQQSLLGNKDPVGGFFSPQYGQLQPAVQLSLHYRISGPTTLCHAISHPRASPVQVELEPLPGSGQYRFTVKRDGRELAQGTLAAMDEPGLLSYTVY